MQWRSLVLGLLLLRLGLQALLALLPALAPGLCLRRRFPFPFPPPAALGPPAAPAGSSYWGSLLRRGGGDGGTTGGDEYERRYSGAFPPQLRARLRDAARGMFVFGYDSYMQHAFPQDELDPLHCRGRGPDHDPSVAGPRGMGWGGGRALWRRGLTLGPSLPAPTSTSTTSWETTR